MLIKIFPSTRIGHDTGTAHCVNNGKPKDTLIETTHNHSAVEETKTVIASA